MQKQNDCHFLDKLLTSKPRPSQRMIALQFLRFRSYMWSGSWFPPSACSVFVDTLQLCQDYCRWSWQMSKRLLRSHAADQHNLTGFLPPRKWPSLCLCSRVNSRGDRLSRFIQRRQCSSTGGLCIGQSLGMRLGDRVNRQNKVMFSVTSSLVTPSRQNSSDAIMTKF